MVDDYDYEDDDSGDEDDDSGDDDHMAVTMYIYPSLLRLLT